MAKKKMQLKKSHALLLTLLVLIFVGVSLFTPIYNISSKVLVNRNVKVSGIDVISALFSDDASLDYESTIVIKNSTGAELVNSIKNTEKFSTVFYLYAIVLILLLIASALTLLLTIYLATFDNVKKFCIKAFKNMNLINAFILLLTLCFAVIFSSSLSFVNTIGGIVILESICKLGFAFYILVAALIACVPVVVFGFRQKR